MSVISFENSALVWLSLPMLQMLKLQKLMDARGMMERLHLVRKFWHLGMGVMMALLYQHVLTRTQGLWILGVSIIWVGLIEFFRLRHKAVNQLAIRFFGPLMRPKEHREISGTLYFICGVFVVVAFLPKPVAILALLYLACGDPIAAFFGTLFSDKTIRFRHGKTLAGFLAGSIACVVVTLLYFAGQPQGMSPMPVSSIYPIALIGGLTAGGVESIDIKMNDNFSVPVVSGFVLFIALTLAGQSF